MVQPGGAVDIQVLGPLHVLINSQPIKLGGRPLDLLARLIALRHDRISRNSLIEDVYGKSELTSSTQSAFRVILAQLRKSLEPHADLIVKGTHYGIDTRFPGLTVDAWNFLEVIERSRVLSSTHRWAEIAHQLQPALQLWKGEPYGGITRVESVDVEGARLQKARLEARLLYAEALLNIGRAPQVLLELEECLEALPDDEHCWSLYLRSLYAAGQRREAVNASYKLVDRLGDVGLEMSPALAGICDLIRRQDPSLDSPTANTGAAAAVTSTNLTSAADSATTTHPTADTTHNGPHIATQRMSHAPRALVAARRGFAGRANLLHDIRIPTEKILLLVGEPGLGKTATLGQILLEQATSDTAIAYGACESDASEGLDPVYRALGLPRPETDLSWQHQLHLLFVRIDAALDNGPLFMILDDLHWADEQTLRFVRQLVQRPIHPGLSVLLAARPSESTAQLQTLPGISTVTLTPLKKSEMVAVAQSIQDEIRSEQSDANPIEITPQLVDELWEVTAGFPMLVRVYVGTHCFSTQEGQDAGASPQYLDATKASLTSTMQQVLHGQQHNARLAIWTAAMLGMSIDEHRIAEINNVPISDVRDAVNHLIGLGFVDNSFPYRFRHELLREWLLLPLDRHERATLHRELANSPGLDTATRALHGLFAVRGEDPQTALHNSEVARKEARQKGAPRTIVLLADQELTLRRQVDELPDRAEFELHNDLVWAHEMLGNSIQGERAREALLAVAERARRLDWAAEAALLPPSNGRSLVSGNEVARISRAINMARPDAPPEILARLRAERVHMLALWGLTSETSDVDRRALAEVRKSDVSIDTWLEIQRARLCSDLADITLSDRPRATAALNSYLDAKNLDTSVDSLLFQARERLENYESEPMSQLLADIDRFLPTTRRPLDEWHRKVIWATTLAVRGALTASLHYAKTAHDYGRLHGLQDAANTWVFQSTLLRTFIPTIPLPDPSDLTMEETPMHGNLLALALSLGAQIFPDELLANEMLSAAKSSFRPMDCDLYRAPVSALIITHSYRMKKPVEREIVEPLRNFGLRSVVAGMLPGWSFGPARTYTAMSKYLDGNIPGALDDFSESAEHSATTRQVLWEHVALTETATILRETGQPIPAELLARTDHVRRLLS